MSLETLRKSLKGVLDEIETLKGKVVADDAKAEDVTTLEEKTAEADRISQKIALIEKAERIAAAQSQPAAQKTTERRPAQAKQHAVDDTPLFSVGVLLAGIAAVKGGYAENVREALDDAGYSQVADTFENATGKQLQSSVGTGSVLVPPAMASDIIEFLRPQTAFLQNNPRRVPLTNGTFFQAGGSTGATAAYGRENSIPLYSEATFRDVNLFAKDLMGKTAISNTLLKRGVSGIRQFIDMDFRSAMAETGDLNLFLGDGQQNRPMGVYNIPGINTRAATDSVSPTVAQVDADARWAINALMNVPRVGWAWTMSQETIGYLEDLRDGNGNPIYPSMQGENKTFKGFPVTMTTNLPTNLGVGGNRSHISLIAWPHVFFGEEEGMTVRVSTEASYTDASGNLRSAAERDETVMFATTKHDVGARHLRAIALLTDVRWGR